MTAFTRFSILRSSIGTTPVPLVAKHVEVPVEAVIIDRVPSDALRVKDDRLGLAPHEAELGRADLQKELLLGVVRLDDLEGWREDLRLRVIVRPVSLVQNRHPYDTRLIATGKNHTLLEDGRDDLTDTIDLVR